MLIKNIERRIKINRSTSLAAMVLSLLIVVGAFLYSYKVIRDSRKSIYIIDNGIPVLVKQTDELLNRPVEYKAQVELFHRLFFTLAPDDQYIKNNVEKALYLIDDTGKREYSSLQERGFYNQLISSNSMMTIQADSINVNLSTKSFEYYGTQTINRKTAVVTRRLITKGEFMDMPRTPNNPHGILLTNWQILDNTQLSQITKYHAF